ncbi:MAG: glycerate kinase [Alphaproteobacteria bacterium]|nr:glycerate kinase [Alphaproteobacteria bacterium]
MQPESILREAFARAVARADPALALAGHLPEPPTGRSFVAAAGKAAGSMAAAFEAAWPGPLEGIAVTRYGHGVPCRRIEVVEAGHPMPDAAGRDVARRILEAAESLGADDLFVFLVSGGGSALLALPLPGISFETKRAVTAALLASGASISEINTVRKHMSAIKGGQLAAAAFPARTVTLAISDVPGDDPTVIASGPTVPDPTTLGDARRILAAYGIDPITGLEETPKQLERCEFHLIATPRECLLDAALDGPPAWLLSDRIEGEAREVGKVMAGIALHTRACGAPFPPPCLLLSGGETTVTLRGTGRGGRNLEFLLGLALALDGAPGIHAIACDTDGIDGMSACAGALLYPDSLARARALGLDPAACLRANDAYAIFAALDDLVVTGPTRTNVNDFRAILVES